MRLSLAALLLQLLCSGAQLDFSGRVSHGQNYHHRISEHLWFCLFEEPDANGGGWRISVQENGCSPTSHDFVAVATPPIYGVNAREIEGWHFDPGANAPKKVREFSFVLTDPDWRHLISDLNTYQDAGKMIKGNGGPWAGDWDINHNQNGSPLFVREVYFRLYELQSDPEHSG